MLKISLEGTIEELERHFEQAHGAYMQSTEQRTQVRAPPTHLVLFASPLLSSPRVHSHFELAHGVHMQSTDQRTAGMFPSQLPPNVGSHFEPAHGAYMQSTKQRMQVRPLRPLPGPLLRPH